MRLKLLTLLTMCALFGCATAPVKEPAPPQGEWPSLGWGTNTPSLDPITNSPPR